MPTLIYWSLLVTVELSAGLVKETLGVGVGLGAVGACSLELQDTAKAIARSAIDRYRNGPPISGNLVDGGHRGNGLNASAWRVN